MPPTSGPSESDRIWERLLVFGALDRQIRAYLRGRQERFSIAVVHRELHASVGTAAKLVAADGSPLPPELKRFDITYDVECPIWVAGHGDGMASLDQYLQAWWDEHLDPALESSRGQHTFGPVAAVLHAEHSFLHGKTDLGVRIELQSSVPLVGKKYGLFSASITRRDGILAIPRRYLDPAGAKSMPSALRDSAKEVYWAFPDLADDELDEIVRAVIDHVPYAPRHATSGFWSDGGE